MKLLAGAVGVWRGEQQGAPGEVYSEVVNDAEQGNRSLGKHWVWAALNVAGMALYLRQAAFFWSLGGTDGLPPGYARFWAGDAFHFALTMAPVLAVFLLVDVGILVFILLRTAAPKRRKALRLWFVVATLWIATLAADRHLSPTLVDDGTTTEDILRNSRQ